MTETPRAAADAWAGDPSVQRVLEQVRVWTEGRHLALVLVGGHARGDAVAAQVGGHSWWLSDLDLWVVMPDAAQRDLVASRRQAAGTFASEAARAAFGFAAAIEIGCVTPRDLARMPARPGTLELKRRGRVVAGDPTVLGYVPAWTAADIGVEERRLLLENRAFELLWAYPRLAGEPLAARAARHAVLKAVADLATVEGLAAGELPGSPVERVAWASDRGFRGSDLAAGEWDALWGAATAWREGATDPLPDPAARAEWRLAARAWDDVWRREAGGVRGVEPWSRTLAMARRSPLRRRVRQGFTGVVLPRGAGRTRALLAAGRGTPRHRVHGAAAVLVLAAARSAVAPSLPAGALRALDHLSVLPAAERRDWPVAARATFALWDRCFHDGQRSGEEA